MNLKNVPDELAKRFAQIRQLLTHEGGRLANDRLELRSVRGCVTELEEALDSYLAGMIAIPKKMTPPRPMTSVCADVLRVLEQLPDDEQLKVARAVLIAVAPDAPADDLSNADACAADMQMQDDEACSKQRERMVFELRQLRDELKKYALPAPCGCDIGTCAHGYDIPHAISEARIAKIETRNHDRRMATLARTVEAPKCSRCGTTDTGETWYFASSNPSPSAEHRWECGSCYEIDRRHDAWRFRTFTMDGKPLDTSEFIISLQPSAEAVEQIAALVPGTEMEIVGTLLNRTSIIRRVS